MKLSTPFQFLAVSAGALAFPALAHAHSVHSTATGWSAGLTHPLFGMDHLIAMIAVGVWAAQMGGRARWIAPAVFLGVMACGSALGGLGFVPPGVEPMIVTSVFVFGLLIATAARLPLTANVALTSLFALFHGVAHGAEMPVAGGTIAYVAGLVVATAALQAGGFLLGRASSRASTLAPRLLGIGCAAAGGALMIF